MIASELQAALAGTVGTEPIQIRTPANPVLDRILSLATVSAAALDGSGNFVLSLAPIALVFRLNAPRDLALDVLLLKSNVTGSHLGDAGETIFEIDT